MDYLFAISRFRSCSSSEPALLQTRLAKMCKCQRNTELGCAKNLGGGTAGLAETSEVGNGKA